MKTSTRPPPPNYKLLLLILGMGCFFFLGSFRFLRGDTYTNIDTGASLARADYLFFTATRHHPAGLMGYPFSNLFKKEDRGLYVRIGMSERGLLGRHRTGTTYDCLCFLRYQDELVLLLDDDTPSSHEKAKAIRKKYMAEKFAQIYRLDQNNRMVALDKNEVAAILAREEAAKENPGETGHREDSPSTP